MGGTCKLCIDGELDGADSGTSAQSSHQDVTKDWTKEVEVNNIYGD